MATDLRCELEEFHRYLGKELERRSGATSIEEAVAEFRAYQDELERCREAIRPALEASLRGESTLFSVEEVMEVVRRRLADKETAE